MHLNFNAEVGTNYKSMSQKVRVMSEQWVEQEIFCPNCGNEINKYLNNKPVKDFYCSVCSEDFELKSKKDKLASKLVDGAYETMMNNLNSQRQANFFILVYLMESFKISNFCVIPKHFFIPEIVEKRKPLANTARRKGWIGCNLLLKYIPESGKVYYIKNSVVEAKDKVIEKWEKTLFLREKQLNKSKGWLIDIMKCIDKLGKKSFTLNEVYSFGNELRSLHSNNKHIKDKIRQQLQVLRDKDYLQFTSRGNYCLK